MPKISVIKTSYNRERYVARAERNFLDQSCPNFEVVITDDASSDKTAAEIKKVTDPRIRLKNPTRAIISKLTGWCTEGNV